MKDKIESVISKQVTGANVLNKTEKFIDKKDDNNNKNIITRESKETLGKKREEIPTRNTHLAMQNQPQNI